MNIFALIACSVQVSIPQDPQVGTFVDPYGIVHPVFRREIKPPDLFSMDDTDKLPQGQEGWFWCWAATVSNIFKYYGYQVSQARVVHETYGAVVDVRSGPYTNITKLMNREWVDDKGKKFVAKAEVLMDVSANYYSPSFGNSYLKNEISKNRPFFIGTSEHAMMGIGVDYVPSISPDTVLGVRVHDPAPMVAGVRLLLDRQIVPVPLGGSLYYVAVCSVEAKK